LGHVRNGYFHGRVANAVKVEIIESRVDGKFKTLEFTSLPIGWVLQWLH
jgi:hypothetical protein